MFIATLNCKSQNAKDILPGRVSEICIGPIKKNDTNIPISHDEFIKNYVSVSFKDCLPIDSSNNVLSDAEATPLSLTNKNGVSGYYGILILKDGEKIPIVVSADPFLVILDKGILYSLNEKKHKEWTRFVLHSMESYKFQYPLEKLSDIVSEVCIGVKEDTSDVTLSAFESFSFNKCKKINSCDNVLKGAEIKHQITLWKGRQYGILILKNGKKIPIAISVYGGFFNRLDTGDTYYISEEKRVEWQKIISG